MGYLLIDKETWMLCNDGKLRRKPLFGTEPECARFYRNLGWAKKKATKMGLFIVEIPSKHQLDITGTISKNVNGKWEVVGKINKLAASPENV